MVTAFILLFPIMLPLSYFSLFELGQPYLGLGTTYL